jgi:MoaA/NifB/PqqE/SkfB family radical SAM enzyme
MTTKFRLGAQRAVRVGRWLVRSKTQRWSGPLQLIHAVTARCNARCGFCAWNPDFYEGRDELSSDEVRDLYQQAWDAGLIALSIWGGEPLLRSDLGDLARHAKQLGFMTNMVTNGVLLARRMDAVLPSIDQLCISIDHPSERHDEIRGVPGLWARLADVVPSLRTRHRGTNLVLNYTLQKDNADPASLTAMAELARSWGAALVFNPMRVDATADGTAGDIDLAAFDPGDDVIAAAYAHVQALKERGYPIINSNSFLARMQHLPLVYHCHWPKFIVPIEANGDVVDCMHWGREPVDNVRNKPLREILRNPRLRQLAGPVGEACHQCRSVHRFELSEIYEGRMEPLWSWGRRLAPNRSLPQS